jgi:hypothetical protein
MWGRLEPDQTTTPHKPRWESAPPCASLFRANSFGGCNPMPKAKKKAVKKRNPTEKKSVAPPVVVGEIDPSRFYRRSRYARVLFGCGKTKLKEMIENDDAPPLVTQSGRIDGWYGRQLLDHTKKKLEAAALAKAR